MRLPFHNLNLCCTRITFASRSGISGLDPNSLSVRRSLPAAMRVMAWGADQLWATRCAPRALMIAVEKEVPRQSAQPDVFCSPLGKLGEIYRPRTASGNPLASVNPKTSPRSEERRVGKEYRCGWSAYHE